MVVQMMEVGEETGQITEMLDKLADFYDHEVETATESLTSALEPLMVVFLGADHRNDGCLPLSADVQHLSAHRRKSLEDPP